MIRDSHYSCCGGSETLSVSQGETVKISCRYPDQFQDHYKYFFKLDDHSVKDIVDTGTKTQRGRFSISDDKGSRNVSLRIRDVKKDDGGVYSCGVWTTVSSTVGSVGYFSFFSEIQLQVSARPPSTAPPTAAVIITDEESSSSFIITITLIICGVLLLIGGLTLIFYCMLRKKRQGSTDESSGLELKDSKQVPPVVCVYEEIKPTKHLPDQDTGVYANASTLTPPKDQDLTYSTVSFHKNPGSPTDSSVSVNKEETETEYATVKRPKEPE
ncbi:uncharacterized protein LOC103025438 [Astyanax mexicanus]|uniref:uncharacterized protein LOC103025438 n=1 Tax=Astyanax mexicanus TaxID=7994 RepID=UPI0020CB0062|nr:uncharacterized protein LOC103025438 [Astyanax mexicanus]